MPPFGVDGWRRVAPKPAPCCGIDPLKRMLRSIALVSEDAGHLPGCQPLMTRGAGNADLRRMLFRDR